MRGALLLVLIGCATEPAPERGFARMLDPEEGIPPDARVLEVQLVANACDEVPLDDGALDACLVDEARHVTDWGAFEQWIFQSEATAAAAGGVGPGEVRFAVAASRTLAVELSAGWIDGPLPIADAVIIVGGIVYYVILRRSGEVAADPSVIGPLVTDHALPVPQAQAVGVTLAAMMSRAGARTQARPLTDAEVDRARADICAGKVAAFEGVDLLGLADGEVRTIGICQDQRNLWVAPSFLRRADLINFLVVWDFTTAVGRSYNMALEGSAIAWSRGHLIPSRRRNLEPGPNVISFRWMGESSFDVVSPLGRRRSVVLE